MRTAGFDVCQSLESIVLLGKPDKKTINEYQNLANLKRLVIVDSLNDNIANEEFRSGIAKALPNAEIQVIPFGQFKPDPPEKFKKHAETIKAKVFERLEMD